jgi:hypothetical protein
MLVCDLQVVGFGAIRLGSMKTWCYEV